MAFDTAGLKKLDATGLKPVGQPRALDATGLRKLDTSGLKPVDTRPRNPMVDDRSVPLGSLARGWNRLQQSGTVLQHEAGLITTEDAAKALARDEADIARYPRSPSTDQGLKEISEAEGWGNSAYAILTNPSAIVSVVGESIPMMAAPVVGGVAGAVGGGAAGSAVPIVGNVAGGTAGLVAGTAAGSFATEYSAVMLDVMRERGVDLTNEGQVRAALGNPEIMGEARERGVKRGIPIAAFDAISFGIAGKVGAPVRGTAREVSRLRTAAALGTEVGAQSVLGAGGEATAQIVETGEISSPGDVLVEGVAESVTGLPEIAIGTYRNRPGETPVAPIPEGALPAEDVIGADPESQAAIDRRIDEAFAQEMAQPITPPLAEMPVAQPLDVAGLTPLEAAPPLDVQNVQNETPVSVSRGTQPEQTAALTELEAAPPLDQPQFGINAGSADVANVNPEVMSRFQQLQEAFGAQLPINSGYRDPARNAAAGGARHSEHMDGGALDIDVRGMPTAERIRLIETASAMGFTGIGVYNNAIHIDLGARRYWGPSYRAESLPAWASEVIGRHMGGQIAQAPRQPGVAVPPPEPIPGANDSRPRLQALLDDPRSAAEIRADMEAARTFRPSPAWQDVPQAFDTTGLEVRDVDGVRQARTPPATGSRDAPLVIETPSDVTYGAEQTAAPSPAQAEAGNYSKRHIQWQGLDISIETERGRERTGIAPDGTPWSVRMPAPYGYIKRTNGADGDQIDVYVGAENLNRIFVVDQIDPKTGKFDEHKLLLGFNDLQSAGDTYEAGFSDGSGASRAGAITEMTVAQLRQWLRNGNARKPVAYQAAKVVKRGKGKGRDLDIVQFLAASGGVSDYQGELRSLGLSNVFIPGFGRLVRQSGRTLDMARELAEEAGYIGRAGEYQVSTIADMLNAIDATRRGERVFAREDMAQGAGIKEPGTSSSRDQEVQREVKAMLAAVGANLRDGELDEIYALIGEGWWPDEAAAEVMERHMLAADAETEQNAPVEDDSDATPFFAEDDAGRADSSRQETAPAVPEPRGADGRTAEGTAPPRDERGSGQSAGRADQGAAVQPAGVEPQARPRKPRKPKAPADQSSHVAAEPEPVAAPGPASESPSADDFTEADVPKFLKTGKEGDDQASEPRFALRRRSSTINDYIDRVVAGEKIAKALVVGETPEVLEALGIDGKYLTIEPAVIVKAMQKHRLSPTDIKSAVADAYDPVLAFGHIETDNVDLVGKTTDSVGRPMVVGVSLREMGAGRLVVSSIRTVHGKDNPHAIADWVQDGQLRYWDRKGLALWLPSIRANSGRIGEIIRRVARFSNPSGAKVLTPEDVFKGGRPALRASAEPASPRVISESFKVGDAGSARAEILLADPFIEAVDRLEGAMRKELNRLGLTDVGMRLAETIRFIVDGQAYPADGRYFRGLIDIALDAEDPGNVLQHEALHALRRGGLFTDEEWAALSNTSPRYWMGRYDIGGRYGAFPDFAQVEEGIAHAYADFATGKLHVGGVIARAFRKIRNFIEALRNALRGLGFQSADDVFAKIASGEIGNRPRRAESGEVAYAIPSRDGDLFASEIVETMDGPRQQMVIPGAEKISDKERAERLMQGRKGSGKPQRDASGLPLFGDEKDQQSLFKVRETPEFKKWFGDSKVVDEDGKPLVVYHGTQANFEAFEIGKSGRLDSGFLGQGMYFTTMPSAADYYANSGVNIGQQIYPVYLSIKNPYDWKKKTRGVRGVVMQGGRLPSDLHDEVMSRTGFVYDADAEYDPVAERDMSRTITDVLRERGYDGVIADVGDGEKEIVAFDPTQIKSATGNRGTFDPSDVNIMFRLRREPRTAPERQRATQGMIARGQPLDRAMRLPFHIFGGVDAQGQWKPGLYVSDKIGKAITTAKFNPKGRFAWMNNTLETARAGLVDRYGLDADYVARDRKRSLDERRIMMEGVEVLKTLSEQNISLSEAKVLQAILTGEKVDDEAMQKLAEPIRVAIDELGQEAVALGLLSPESYERNRGAYLHRVYMKHETDQNALTRFVGRMMGRNRQKIVGDQFKGRGMFMDVDAARLTKDDPEWVTAGRGKPAKGEKFRILDQMQAQGDMLDSEAQPRAVRRVYWPADRAVPAKYHGWNDNGVWEIRGESGGKLTLWRDYTKAERASMGEILDARYTIGKTYMMMAHDLATGRFYKDIAENEQWTVSKEPDAKWRDAAEASRYLNDPETQWIKVPETAIPQSGGKKRWGALAGKWVRSEIWRDLNEIAIMQRPTTWRWLLTQWKLNKTARSPVVHMNNVMSNLMFMDMADIRLQDLKAGVKAFVSRDQNYREAFEHGAFGVDMMSQEVRDNVLKPVLDEIAKAEKDGEADGFMARARLLGRFADRLGGLYNKADQFLRDTYQIEDEVFRMATYMRRRQMGDSPADAADFARQQFLDYDIRAPWVNAARNSVLPFISYTYRAVPLIARAIATRPWKLPKYFLIAYMLNALAYGWDDEGDEDRERASLRDEEQGYTWLGVPRMLRMPFRDSHGLPVFLDIRRWIPAGDVFDTGQGASALPIPAPIQFGGPMMMAAELALNKQGFTGEPITNELTDTWWDKAKKVGDYAWKSWMPSAAWVPGSWYWTKLENAIKGATDAQGRPYDLPTAVSSSMGIKVKPQDVESGLYWHGYELRQVEKELKAQARALGRQRERNLISQSAFERQMGEIMTKFERVAERQRELQEHAAIEDDEAETLEE